MITFICWLAIGWSILGTIGLCVLIQKMSPYEFAFWEPYPLGIAALILPGPIAASYLYWGFW